MNFKALILPFLFVASLLSCSVVKPVVHDVNDPNTVVGAVVADCVKPEIADQVANVLAGINQIIVDPSKTSAVKEAEIASLKAGGQEVLACALRAGIADITAMIRNAVGKHAAVDPRVLDSRDTMLDVVTGQGFKYADGWTPAGASP